MTFTFTIDCFPAYTKFNKTKKVMASLQVLDAEEYKHNYADKTVIGHIDREDTEEYTADDQWKAGYPKSIWDEDGDDTTDPDGDQG